jgi:hypothetical protein
MSLLFLRINLKLYSENETYSEKKRDIISQLNFLEAELKTKNLGQRMQEIYPEGNVFINAIYGLAWCELANADNSHDKNIKEKAISEALYAYHEINSEKAKSPFDYFLIPEYGIFYFGWRNYLLSKILSIDTTFMGHESYIDTFFVQCETLNNIIKDSERPYLESYYHQSWPGDMSVAMASLSNYNKIFGSRYNTSISIWLKKVKERLDPETKMIPHKVDYNTMRSIQGSRGCSMSLILRMLSEIDTDFADKQYKLFEEKFVTTTFGLPSVREYPNGKFGMGDVDSGPVIFGVGFVATIVMIGTFSTCKRDDLVENQYKTINAFGFERKNKNQKSYLFGMFPMADAFIAWGRATALNNFREAHVVESYNWRLRFHIISLLVVFTFWFIYFRKSIIKNIRTFTNKRND